MSGRVIDGDEEDTGTFDDLPDGAELNFDQPERDEGLPWDVEEESLEDDDYLEGDDDLEDEDGEFLSLDDLGTEL